MRLIYIAGPYRGNSMLEIHNNIRAAEAVAIDIWKRGDVAICPHKNTAFFDGLACDETWLKGDLEILRRCDGIIMAPGWINSSGSRAELALARELKLEIEHACFGDGCEGCQEFFTCESHWGDGAVK